MEKKQSKLLPLLSLIFGIASILTSCILIISLPLAVTSIILAIVSFIKKKPVAMPVVGLICSFGGIIAAIVLALVGTTLGIALGQNSVISSAKEAANSTSSYIEKEQEAANSIESYIEKEQEAANSIESYIEKEQEAAEEIFNQIKEENTIIENTEIKNTTNEEISNNWKDGEFIFNGKKYKLFDKYSNLELAGWSFDMADYGYDDGYVLNSRNKTYGTISLENDESDCDVTIGLINDENEVLTIKKCAFWSFSADNSFAKNPATFTLAKGIKNGSTLAEVKAAYGEPDDTYYSESFKYWNYTYDNDLAPQLRLTIYEDEAKGLVEFEYKYY